MQPPISVVTPFHNTASYLAEAIESVLGQSYDNFEYILVDNQSTDGGGEIAAAYAAKDARIRVVKTPELYPQLKNYNFTLAQISRESRYVKVVQADDWIFPRCLVEMATLADRHPSIAVVSGYELQGTQVIGTGLYPTAQLISGRDACRHFILDGICMFGSPTTVLYRADLVRERPQFFPEQSLHADTEIVFELLDGRDFGMVHQVLSYTRVRPESISGSVSDFAPEALDRLILIKRHGRRCLDEAEYERMLTSARGWVHGSLVRKSIRGFKGASRRAFISYQRDGLRSVDEDIEPKLVAKHLGAALAEEVLSPFGVLPMLKALGKRS